MSGFNKTVLLIASVLLILALIIIGFVIVKNVQNSSYPPIISDCPDYWDVSYDSNKNKICRSNSINTGVAANSSNNCRNYPVELFKASGTSTNDMICEKSNWAKKCNIQWDGITNNSKACSNTTI